MLDSFFSFIFKHQLLPQKGPTLLAVSGGVDSVVMAQLFHRAKLQFAIAHCNFSLRGAASDQDEIWVRNLAQQYGVTYHAQLFDVLTHARTKGVSIQMAARELRHAWFQLLCNEHGFEKIATAHHSNDSLETVLLQFTKGTGLSGLHGILPAQGRYVRPLIFAKKTQIIAYAQAEGLHWREDSSNQKDKYHRNLIRHQVVPQLRKINPNVETTFCTTLERLRQVEALWMEQVNMIRKQACFQKEMAYYVKLQTLQNKSWAPVMLWELLKPFGFQFTPLKQLFASSPSAGARLQSASHYLYVDRCQWVVTPRTRPDRFTTYKIGITTQSISIPHYTLYLKHIARSQYHLIANQFVAALDQDRLNFPLDVRKWQPGDVFYPLGMQQRKKLSDFLIDSKVPRPLKEQVWVITSKGEIVWVVGHRIDNRFRVTDSTEQVYELQLTPVPELVVA